MSKTFDPAPDEVRDRVIALMKRFHPDLELVQLRVDLLFASTDAEDAHAVTLGGYPCLAVVKIVGPKERAKGLGDAEIVIDRDAYEAMSDAQRDALLDHELYHLEIVRDKLGRPKRDDYQRPKLKMRKHDFQFGWFAEIARRHQENAIEVQQARAFAVEQAQTFFGFNNDVMSSLLPTEDSAARDVSPARSIAEQLINEAAESRGVGGLVELSKRDGVTMEISTGGKSVKIDGEGVHYEPTAAELDAATKLAFREGHVTRSMLQRNMSVGYNRACAIVAKLVSAGLVAAESEGGRFITTAQSDAHREASPTVNDPAAPAAA